MENDYVLNHDFGYGREEEIKELNRLKLRNLNDVETYVLEIIKSGVVCSEGKKVFLIDSKDIEVVEIKMIEE